MTLCLRADAIRGGGFRATQLFLSYNHAKEPKREFKVGDKIRVNLHHGKIEDAVVRAVIDHTDGTKLQVDFGHEQTALIALKQVVSD